MSNTSTLQPSTPARYAAIMAAAKKAKLTDKDVNGVFVDEEQADDEGSEEGYFVIMSERATKAYMAASESRKANNISKLDSVEWTNHLATAWQNM